MATFFASDDASLVTALADAAANGTGVDTIVLTAGTYSAAHTINTAVILSGPKVGQAGNAAGRGLAEANFTGGLMINTANVTLDGIQIAGANDFGALTFDTGLYVNAANATVQNVRFAGTSDAAMTASGTALNLVVTLSAFSGYQEGMHVFEGATGNINTNVFSQVSSQIGIVTESTGLVIGQNTFLNGGGAGPSISASPNGSTDLSTQILANNTIPPLSGAHSIDVEVRGSGAFTVTGTAFDDRIYTADDPDHVAALTLIGLGGNDELFGGDGNDIFDGGTGADILRGQGGSDTASYSGSLASVQVDLSLGNAAQTSTGDASGDRLFGIANVTGSAFNDTLIGDGSANVLTGSAGVDTLAGGGGNDTFVVNAGDAAAGETYNGGLAESDTLLVTGSADFTGASLLSIENLTFLTTATSTVTLTSSQVGGANLVSNLAVTGDAQTNRIVINMNGVLLDLSGWSLSGWAGADSIMINGTSSNDTITGSSQNDIITGGLGNDALTGGAGDDAFNYFVGDGADTIDGGTHFGLGDTVIVAGTSGNDTLSVTYNGAITSLNGGTVVSVENFTVDLGGGTNDKLDYTGSSVGVTVNLSSPFATGFSSVLGVESATGGSGADSLTGDANANTLDGGLDGDTLTGLAGVDTLFGRAGNDLFIVNAGDAVAGETYDGGADNDTLRVTGSANFTGSSMLSLENLTFATAAASTVTFTSSQIGGANLSAALAVTGDGNANNIVVNMNSATLDVGGWNLGTWTTGQDTFTILGTGAAETIISTSRNDVINAGAGGDSITAGTGDDVVIYLVGDGVDAIDGGTNTGIGDSLLIFGTAANDTISVVLAGNLISGLAGGTVASIENAFLNMGDGTIDTLDYTGTVQAVTVNLTTPSATGFNTIAGVESVIGGTNGDTLTGSAISNVLDGAGGNDTINGNGGIDVLRGGAGDDNFIVNAGSFGATTYDGGTNSDTMTFAGSADLNGAALLSIEKMTFATGGTSSVILTSNQLGGANLAANLAVTGDANSNNISILMNGPLADLSQWTFTTWTNGADTISVTGSSGSDTIFGSSQNDSILGDAGADVINAGGGNDVISSGLGADVVTGGAGADILRVGVALAEAQIGIFDRFTDYSHSAGDQVDLSAILNSGSLVRAIASGTGANLQIDVDGTANGTNWITITRLDGVKAGDSVNVIRELVVPAGVNLTVQQAATLGSFDGDNKADIQWQNDNGTPAIWLMNGVELGNAGPGLLNPGSNWKEIGTGDFNGDGKSDILWQSSDGTPAVWLMDGTSVQQFGGALPSAGPTWKVKEAADFNGDGRADILWQNDGGAASVWLMNGTNLITAGAALPNPGPTWKVNAAGDFNGDGKADILWQNNDGTTGVWLMDGTNLLFAGGALPNAGPSWHALASGDFNGDGKSDILWQNDNGAAAVWLMDGTTLLAASAALTNPGPTWHVKEAMDFDGNGKADILWQNDNGAAAVWLMDGITVSLFGGALPNPGPTWHVV